jgi:hypothetical protein
MWCSVALIELNAESVADSCIRFYCSLVTAYSRDTEVNRPIDDRAYSKNSTEIIPLIYGKFT